MRRAPQEHHGWLCSRLDFSPTILFHAIEVVDASGRILAMVGYDGWTRNSVQVLMAIDSPAAARALIRPAFEYPFLQEGRGVLHAFVSSRNTESLRITRKLGFRELCRMKDAHSVGIDVVALELRREDCRWISSKLKKVAA